MVEASANEKNAQEQSLAHNFRLAFAKDDQDAETLLLSLREELSFEVEPIRKARLHYEIAALLLRYRLEAQATKELVQAWNLDPEFRPPIETLIALFELKPTAKNLDKLYDALARSSKDPPEQRFAELRVLLLRDFADDELLERLTRKQEDEGPFEDIAAIFALRELATGSHNVDAIAKWVQATENEELALTLALVAASLYRERRENGAAAELLRDVRARFRVDDDVTVSATTRILHVLLDAELLDERVQAGDSAALEELLREHQADAPELFTLLRARVETDEPPVATQDDLGTIAAYVGNASPAGWDLPDVDDSPSQLAYAQFVGDAFGVAGSGERTRGEAVALRAYFRRDAAPDERVLLDIEAAEAVLGEVHQTFFARVAWVSALRASSEIVVTFDARLAELVRRSDAAVAERVAWTEVFLRVHGPLQFPALLDWLSETESRSASANALLATAFAQMGEWSRLEAHYQKNPGTNDAAHLAHFRAAWMARDPEASLIAATRFADAGLRQTALTFLLEEQDHLPSDWRTRLEQAWQSAHDHDALSKALASEMRGDVTRAAFAYRTLGQQGALAHELGGMFFLGLRDPKRARALLERADATWAQIALLPEEPKVEDLLALRVERPWQTVVDALWLKLALRDPDARGLVRERLAERPLAGVAALLDDNWIGTAADAGVGEAHPAARVLAAHQHLEALATASELDEVVLLAGRATDAVEDPNTTQAMALLLRGFAGDAENAYIEAAGLEETKSAFVQANLLSIADDAGERADALLAWLNSLPSEERARADGLSRAQTRALLLAGRGNELTLSLENAWDAAMTRLASKQTRDVVSWLASNQALLHYISDPKVRVDLLLECAELCVDEQKDLQAALSFLEEALRLVPTHRAAFDLQHDVLASLGDLPRLLEQIAARIALLDDAHELSDLFYEKARLLRASGQLDEALAALSELFLLEEDHPGGLALSAEISVARGEWDEAAQALTQFARHPDLPIADRRVAYLGAADLLLAHERETAAFEHLKNAPYEIFEPMLQERLTTLGRKLHQLEAVVRYAEGLWRAREQTYKNHQDAPQTIVEEAAEAACFLANAHLATGHLDLAERMFREALRIHPASEAAAEGLLALPRKS